ncbi:class I SAM-dependent methyltransferase [Streptomyces sp. NPDC005760]|uniref:O-methyltransferase n=1 Tax=Streptomyces sp. NPDC005760 TaxID=3156718 RepID=UPI00341072FA
MTTLPPLTSRQADALADRLLEHCAAAGVLPPAAGEPWEEFHRLRAHLTPRVDVPMTSLTPLLARILFAVGGRARPARIAVLGSYAGNLMMWLTAQGFGPHRSYEGLEALGADVDEEAVALARRNLVAAGFRGTSVHTADAFDAERLSKGRGPFDAVLIDIDEPVRRKAGYLPLLRRWLPHLAPGALVLAHDVLHPRFAGELKNYLDFVSGPGFAASTTLPVDECGVALSVLDPNG